MRFRLLLFLSLALATISLPAQQHRAVRLGHPLTRFAPPLSQPEQLRALFVDDLLKSDVTEILRQVQWKGNVEDLRRAAATAPVSEVSIPVGTRMPFMSSRKNGKPEVLIDVLWDGDAPISAYAFDFTSNGRRYRCITPKPCSNFYTVDLGAAQSQLALACTAPGEALVGRRFDVCLIVTNSGTAPEPMTTLRLQTPADAKLLSVADQGTSTENNSTWIVRELQPGTAKQVCASFLAGQPALMAFTAAAEDGNGRVIKT